jgi:hypothetical protein
VPTIRSCLAHFITTYGVVAVCPDITISANPVQSRLPVVVRRQARPTAVLTCAAWISISATAWPLAIRTVGCRCPRYYDRLHRPSLAWVSRSAWAPFARTLYRGCYLVSLLPSPDLTHFVRLPLLKITTDRLFRVALWWPFGVQSARPAHSPSLCRRSQYLSAPCAAPIDRYVGWLPLSQPQSAPGPDLALLGSCVRRRAPPRLAPALTAHFRSVICHFNGR